VADTSAERVDLRQREDVPARTFVFYHLKELQPGRVLDLISDEEPTPLMHSVSALMRQGIDWEILEQGPPLWRLKVRRRENVAAGSLAGLLMRDHERLDRLLAHTLQKVNAGEGRAARAPYELFALGVRRHIHAENDVLAPELVETDEARAKQSLVTMLTEREGWISESSRTRIHRVKRPPESGMALIDLLSIVGLAIIVWWLITFRL
jgi:uncharacterized protein (DUF2249 family)